VYLDDIVFLSDRSLASTAGPVRFVSRDAQMQGTGLEVIYDDLGERLDYFRIADLDSLRIRATQAAALSAGTAQAQTPTETGVSEPNAAAVAGGPQETQAPPPEPPAPPVAQQEGVFYKCIVSKNVLVDAPDQLLFANQKLYLNDIFWSKSSLDQSEEPSAGGTGQVQAPAPADQLQSLPTVAASEPDVPVAESAEPNEPNAPAEQPVFITVTCDGGLVIVPKDSTRTLDDSNQTDPNAEVSDGRRAELLAADEERTKFFARTIDYNAMTEDVVAAGLSELTYYTANAGAGEANEPPVPVRVTARDGAKYFKASNQAVLEDCLCRMPQSGLSEPRDVTFTSPQITVNIPADKSRQPDLLAAGPTNLVFYAEDANAPADGPVPVTVSARRQARYSGDLNQMLFEGDCRSTMLREDPNAVIEYVILSDRLSVDLARDVNTASAGLGGGVKHLTASGRVVNLAATKRAKAGGAFAEAVLQAGGTDLLSGIELKCRQLDYDAVEQLFLATGPGLIKLVNPRPAEPNEQADRFSLRKPCVALIQRFETLKYLIAENRIIADAGSQKMLIDYFSTVGGRAGGYARAEASHVDAFLEQTPQGQTDLATLAATGGIYYEDTNNRFLGSELFYDHQSRLATVQGDESQRCYYNGALVDDIKLDLNTGKVEATVVAPGALQFNRQ
jgi:hypothetical protein